MKKVKQKKEIKVVPLKEVKKMVSIDKALDFKASDAKKFSHKHYDFYYPIKLALIDLISDKEMLNIFKTQNVSDVKVSENGVTGETKIVICLSNNTIEAKKEKMHNNFLKDFSCFLKSVGKIGKA